MVVREGVRTKGYVDKSCLKSYNVGTIVSKTIIMSFELHCSISLNLTMSSFIIMILKFRVD